MKNNIELLAPAGSMLALKAALQSGADAVYIGGSAFSARAGANNFNYDEMIEATQYCHLYGVKVHVAVNTLVKQSEIGLLKSYICELTNAGVDAVIVQDIGTAQLIHEISPSLSLHASTQMSVSSIEGVLALEKMGFERVVLARELSIQEIKTIIDNTTSEIEVFCHGAICMCYSGQCLISSMIGGRSGNRGSCAQPCRLPYELMDGTNKICKGYLLSPKDLALVGELDQLRKIGVASLKIEGRLKRPEYVAAVTGVYRKYLDQSGVVDESDTQELLNAFNRSGFTKAYFAGDTGHSMMSLSAPGNVAEQVFTKAVKDRAREDANIRKIPITISIAIQIGRPLSIVVSDGDNTIYESGSALAEYAVNRPIDKDRVINQVSKTGATPFLVTTVEIDMDDNVTLPVSEINSVRREALDRLENKRQSQASRQICEIPQIQEYNRDEQTPMLVVEVSNIDQARVACDLGVKTIYVPFEIADEISKSYPNVEVVAKMPEIFDGDIKLPSTPNILVENMAQAYKYNKCAQYGDFRLNIFNSVAVDVFKDMRRVTVSPELNLKEIASLARYTTSSLEVIAYGRLPLMLMKNCPIKAASGKCQKYKQIYTLRDRMGEQFPIICGHGCRAKLLNSKPIFMADKLQDIIKTKINAVRLIFTVENSKECDTIINVYKKALGCSAVENPFGEQKFTRGHFYRGVK